MLQTTHQLRKLINSLHNSNMPVFQAEALWIIHQLQWSQNLSQSPRRRTNQVCLSLLRPSHLDLSLQINNHQVLQLSRSNSLQQSHRWRSKLQVTTCQIFLEGIVAWTSLWILVGPTVPETISWTKASASPVWISLCCHLNLLVRKKIKQRMKPRNNSWR